MSVPALSRGRSTSGQSHSAVAHWEHLSQGMRERAVEIVSLDLGPRTDHQIESRLRAEVEQERFTSLDRGLLRDADQGIVISGTVAGDPRKSSSMGSSHASMGVKGPCSADAVHSRMVPSSRARRAAWRRSRRAWYRA
jgi:hypothetical protein